MAIKKETVYHKKWEFGTFKFEMKIQKDIKENEQNILEKKDK